MPQLSTAVNETYLEKVFSGSQAILFQKMTMKQRNQLLFLCVDHSSQNLIQIQLIRTNSSLYVSFTPFFQTTQHLLVRTLAFPLAERLQLSPSRIFIIDEHRKFHPIVY